MRLPRTARLLRASDFAALRADAQRLSGRYFRVEYRDNALEHARLGMAVSRRVSKRAVVRNRIRRTIRENFRLSQVLLPAFDMLLIARTSAAEAPNAELRDELQTLWRKLAALKDRGAPGTMRADSRT